MIDDATLLRRYAHEHAQDAFAELVRRHLDLVYSAALRRTGGDAHRAADIAQVVFARLAHDAAALASHAVLAGWLYTATRNAALNTLRTEERRRAREQEAYRMQEISSPPEPDADWQQLRPVLDAAMDELDERDREAVLVRFFQGRPFAEVAAVLRVSEDAARKRVERALEKLRDRLARRGITSTAGLLAGVLSQQAVSAAPAAVASAVASAGAVALTGAGAVSAGAEIMAMFTKTKLAALGAAAILGIGWHYTAVARLDRQYVADEARQETMLATERAEHRRLLASSPPPVGEIGRVAAAPMPAEETLDPLMRTRAAMAIVKEGDWASCDGGHFTFPRASISHRSRNCWPSRPRK